jgi:hypothetical protein
MRVETQDYELMRAWLAYMAREAIPEELYSPEVDPIAHFDLLASRSQAKARDGLSMAINDFVELTDGWSHEQVAATDLSLQQNRLPTLTEVRARFSKLVQRAVRRGTIKDELEYYAARNAAELTEGDRKRLLPLLAAYEEHAER